MKKFQNFLWYSSSIKKNFDKFECYFFKKLDFMEFEYHGKLEFPKLKYPKSDKSLHIYEIVVD